MDLAVVGGPQAAVGGHVERALVARRATERARGAANGALPWARDRGARAVRGEPQYGVGGVRGDVQRAGRGKREVVTAEAPAATSSGPAVPLPRTGTRTMRSRSVTEIQA